MQKDDQEANDDDGGEEEEEGEDERSMKMATLVYFKLDTKKNCLL